MTYRVNYVGPEMLTQQVVADLFDADAHAFCVGPLRETCDRSYFLIERVDDEPRGPRWGS